MSEFESVYRRIRRRETHSPRSGLAIVVAVIVIVICLLAATEIILRLVGQPPLAVSLSTISDGLVDVPAFAPAIVIAIGAVAALVGLALVIAALLPARTARHTVSTERSAAVVDNEVIASALARHAARAGNVSPDNARVSVSHRLAVVRLTPASGVPVDLPAVEQAVTEQLEGYGLVPSVRSKVIVEESGKVGA